MPGEPKEKIYAINYPNCFRCPFNKGKKSCSYDCIKEAEEVLSNPEIGAFLFEPILGSGGAIKPTQEYMECIKKAGKKIMF